MVARTEYRSIVAALVLSLVAALFLAWLPRLPEQVLFRVGALGPLIAEGETTQIRSFYGFTQGPARFHARRRLSLFVRG